MMDQVRKRLALPVFEDEERTHVAGLLHVVLLSIMAFAVLYGITAPFLYTNPIPLWLGVGVAVPLWLISLLLLRRGRVRLAALLFLSVLWLIVTFVALVYGRAQASATSTYITVIFAAGLLLGVRTGFAFAGLSLLAGLGILYAGARGALPASLAEATPVAIWAGLVTNLVLAVVLLHLVASSIRRSLERARRDERALVESNLELEAEIAERRRAEEALRQSEERYRTVLDTIEDGYYEVDLAGNLTFFNDALTAIIGYPSSELLGMNNRQYMNEDNAAKAFRTFNHVYNTGRPSKGFDWELVRKDGTRRWIEASISLVKDAAGGPIGFRGIARDITERKDAEGALRRERDLVSSIMETSPAGITVVNLEGQVTFANPRAEQVLGLTRDKIVQRSYNAPEWHITDYEGNPYPDEELPFRRVLATGKPVFDVRHAIEWPDGHRVLLSINAAPVLDEEGRVDGMVATVEDVTERVQAVEILRESERKFRSIIERSPDGIILTDEEGIIIEWNPGAEQITGLSREDASGRPLWDVQAQMILGEQSPERYERNKTMLVELLKTGQATWLPGLRDMQIRRSDGTQRTVQTLVFIIQTTRGFRLGSILRDITDSKRAEEEIRKLSRAIEQSPSTVVITDTEGHVEYANPRFTQLTGYTIEEILGQTPSILKSGEHEPEFYKDLWETITGGGEWRDEFANRKKNGEIYWELASISPVRDADGVITHYVKVAEDITVRKQAEEALRQRTAELEARNEELDSFAHTVAHDLQNPLGVMIGFAEALEQDLGLFSEEELKTYLGMIAQHGRKMGNIIEELLLLSGVRQTDVELVPVDMTGIVVEARQRLDDMIEEYQAEIVVPGTWPTVWGYGPWLEEVWVNYISNAIKYGGRPPRVELGADPLPSLQSGETERGQARFWVWDNGPGLTPEEQARLFVPFTQLAQVRVQGHGLGLSIVRRIVEKLGGQVGVESEGVPGRGSVFSFTLPLATG